MTAASSRARATLSDRNLLLGILALQLDFISRDGLIAGMQAWVLAKERSLADHLVDLGSLTAEHRQLLDPLVAAHLRRHGDDPQQSLAALHSGTWVNDLRQVEDDQLQASLQQMSRTASPSHDHDPLATVDTLGSEGTREDRFRILRPHAEGGLGMVYVARDQELGREVAIKEIKRVRADDEHSRSRFMREAEITGGLEHPGIVPVYSLGAYPDGRPFYAMRLIRGESLKDALEAFHREEPEGPGGTQQSKNSDERRLQLRRLLQRLVAVCEATDYAHSRGVLHRDLKPANIMLGKYGETLIVDWGLAKAMGQSVPTPDDEAGEGDRAVADLGAESPIIPSADTGSEPTLDGSALGTPGFLSPEQAQGRLDLVGPTSDVFNLGATLYAILTGRPPYHGDDPLGSARLTRFPAPRTLRRDVPRALQAICLKAMAAQPADRYPTARLLAQDLERHLADQPVSAYQEPAGERLSRWARHNRSWVRAGGWAMLTTCGVSVLAAMICFSLWTEAMLQRADALEARSRADAARITAEDLAARNAEIAKLERDQREMAEQLAKEKVTLANEKGALADFLLGTFQTADPIGMGGSDFFIPKQDSETLTALEILNRGAERIRTDPQFVSNGLAQASVMDAIGNAYRQLGSFDHARPLLEDALRIRRELLPDDHADLADSCFHLGWCFHEMGDFPRARPLYEEALRIRKPLQTPDNLRHLGVIQRNLAWMLAYEWEAEEAEKLFRDTIATQTAYEGHSPKDLAIAKFGLAFCLIDGGKVLEATPVVWDAHREWTMAQQNPHFNEAATAFCLGIIARSVPDVPGQTLLLGKNYNLRQSETQLRRALQAFSGAAGPEHYITGVMHFELARTLRQLGKLDEAEAEFHAALKIGREKIHMEHPRLIIALEAVGTFLNERGKTDEARALWAEFLAGQKRRFGAEHKYVASALQAHARFLIWLDEYAPAENDLRECIGIAERNSQVSPTLQGLASADLGFCQLRQKKYDVAETSLLRALELLADRTSRFDDLPYERLRAVTDLAVVSQELGKRSEAERYFQSAEAAAAAYAGSKHDRLLAQDYVWENEARFWREVAEPQRAADLSLKRRELWPNDPDELVSIAKELAACAKLAPMGDSSEGSDLRGTCVREALSTLRSAIKAGYHDREELEKGKRFEILRDQPEFQKLLERLP